MLSCDVEVLVQNGMQQFGRIRDRTTTVHLILLRPYILEESNQSIIDGATLF